FSSSLSTYVGVSESIVLKTAKMGYGSYAELVLYGEHPTRQESVESHPERWSMEASSLTSRLRARAAIRDWAWWQLDWPLRCYIAAVPAIGIVLACYAAVHTTWHVADLWKFLLLVTCGLVSVAATPRIAYAPGIMTRDFLTVWVLPVAILLPPV